MLVVMEGLDGAGKSTQVKKLKAYLEGICTSLEYIHFPRYDGAVYGNLISRFLRGDYGTNDAVHPQLVALLFAEDRHSAAPQMIANIAAGGSVLLDRYVYSNVAYQCAKVKDPAEREELRKWILDTEYHQFALPVPDLNIFLDVPIGFVESRLEADRQGDDRSYLHGHQDIHEADIDFQKRVRELYQQQASLDPKFKRIDCSDANGNMLPPDDIFLLIKKLVDEYMRLT